jgi:hypothetical protein
MIDPKKMEALGSCIEECSVELAKVLNGSVVEVELSSPVLRPTCWMTLRNGKYVYDIHLKPVAKRDKDVYFLLVALWDGMFHDGKRSPHTTIPFEDVRSTPQFAVLRGKFLDAVSSVDRDALRQAIDKNRKEQHRQMLAMARDRFKQVSKELVQLGASTDELQSIMNEVLVSFVHEA